jgi:acyl carrier protein
MGIDLLDVTFRIEKSFDIDLSKEEFFGLERDYDIIVGDLYGLILQKLHLREVGRFDVRLNEQLWLKMQFLLHSVTAVPLHEIELKSPLETIFPRETRRKAWDAFRAVCPYRVGELDYPDGVRGGGLLLAAGVALIEQFQIWQIPGAQLFWPVLGLLGIWVFGETYLKLLSICAPLRNRFPSRMTTVKDLCRTILAVNYVDICNRFEFSSDKRYLTIWQKLVEILASALGVDPDEVTLQSRLVRDLGAG